MSSKRDSGDWAAPRRLFSVREKMSGLVQRGRGLAKKTTMSMLREPRHERPSLDENQKAFPRVQVQDFGTSTLDIDLQSLEAFRIAPEGPQQERKAPVQQQSPPKTSSTTPIADMFRRTTTLQTPTVISTSSLNKSSPALSAPTLSSSKPTIFKVPYEESRTGPAAAAAPSASRTTNSSTKNSSSTPAVSVTIISSSHNQSQPQPAKPWPPPETPRSIEKPSRFSNASDSRQSTRPQVYEPRRAAYVPSGPAPITTPQVHVARPRLNVGAVAEQQQQHTDKRHSTPIATSTHGALTIAVPRLLGVDNSQTDRRRSWQTAPTSVPSSTPRSSGPPSASAPWRESTQRASARIAADRLAWIREIEAKKNKPTVNSDLPVLKKMQGSVADKLARFESKQQQQQQMAVPLTRSNSTRSRTSSMADTFSSSMGGGVATTRSSLDSHRTSSVFSHYDDSFRDKMEFITSNAKRKTDDDADERPPLNRVTASFVSVDKAGKQAAAAATVVAKSGDEGQISTETPVQTSPDTDQTAPKMGAAEAAAAPTGSAATAEEESDAPASQADEAPAVPGTLETDNGSLSADVGIPQPAEEPAEPEQPTEATCSQDLVASADPSPCTKDSVEAAEETPYTQESVQAAKEKAETVEAAEETPYTQESVQAAKETAETVETAEDTTCAHVAPETTEPEQQTEATYTQASVQTAKDTPSSAEEETVREASDSLVSKTTPETD